MKFCPQCGTTLEQGSRFCQECGFNTAAADTVLPEEVKPLLPDNLMGIGREVEPHEALLNKPVPITEAKQFCPQCGAAMEPDDVFCQNCGHKTDAIHPPVPEVSSSPPEEVVEIHPEPIPENHPVIKDFNKQFCPGCGGAMEPADVFCQNCGSKTDAIHPPVPEVSSSPPDEVVEIHPEPIPENHPVVKDFNKQFCPGCGAAMELDDVFCQNCGYKTNTDAESPMATATVIPPAIEKPVAVAPTPPANTGPEVFVAPLPPPPTVKQTVSAQTPKPLEQAAFSSTGKKKSLLVILLAILALAAIGAGGWFAYDKFLKNPDAPAIDSTSFATQQETLPMAEPLVDTTSLAEQSTAEIPTSEPQTEAPKPAKDKQATPKKTLPKKQATEPNNTQSQTQEPENSSEPLKVKIKPVGSKTGRSILSIYNDKEVKSGPLFASKLKLNQAFIITKITTFHYNWGKGAQPGTISLQKRKETFGPWQASGIAGDDGTPDAKWICEPNQRLEEGTYKIEVSDEKSWSYNGQSGQKGFVVVEGYEAD